MKKVLLSVLLALPMSLFAQNSIPETDWDEILVQSEEGLMIISEDVEMEGHNILFQSVSSKFEEEVSSALKKYYPATVVEIPTVRVSTAHQERLHIKYVAIIKRCEPENAMYYFTRRGYLLETQTDNAAVAKATSLLKCNEQLQTSLPKFEAVYGKAYCTDFVQSEHLHYDGKRLALTEVFIFAKK